MLLPLFGWKVMFLLEWPMDELPRSASEEVMGPNSKIIKGYTYILDRFLNLVRDRLAGLSCPCRGKSSPDAVDRVCGRFATSLTFSTTGVKFDKALGRPHIVREDGLIRLREPIGKKRSLSAVLLAYMGQCLLSPGLQCIPIKVFAIVCHRF